MGEFKFSCPHCGQRIQASDAHAGLQTSCPSCQKSIVVPNAPGVAAPAPAPAPAPVPSGPALAAQRPAPGRYSPGIQSAARAAARPSAKKRSPALRATLIVVGVLLLCGALGGGGWFGYKIYKTKFSPEAKAAAKAAEDIKAEAKNAAGPAGQQASDILAKIVETYQGLDHFAATGVSATAIDISQVNPADIPGAKNAKRPDALPKGTQRTQSDVSIKLGRPDLYRIETSPQNPANLTAKKGAKGFTSAIWSTGTNDGDFMCFDVPSPGKVSYFKMTNHVQALSMAGQSGGLSAAVAQIFFGQTADLTKTTKNWAKMADASLNSEDCFVLSGRIMGMKLQLWVSKNTYLIMQSQVTLGGQLDTSDPAFQDQMNKAAGKKGKNNAKNQAAVKQVVAMVSKMKGTVTETYLSIDTNTVLTVGDFKYPVPAGAKLGPAPF